MVQIMFRWTDYFVHLWVYTERPSAKRFVFDSVIQNFLDPLYKCDRRGYA
jgi:hypothetical protein